MIDQTVQAQFLSAPPKDDPLEYLHAALCMMRDIARQTNRSRGYETAMFNSLSQAALYTSVSVDERTVLCDDEYALRRPSNIRAVVGAAISYVESYAGLHSDALQSFLPDVRKYLWKLGVD